MWHLWCEFSRECLNVGLMAYENFFYHFELVRLKNYQALNHLFLSNIVVKLNNVNKVL